MTVSIQMAGVLIGAVLAGQMGDAIGRRKTLMIMTTSMMILQTVLGFSNSWVLFTVLRFFAGMAVGTLVVCYTLPMEFIGSKYRTFCGSLCVYGVGNMLMALAAYLIRDWRYLGVAVGLSSLPMLIAIFWICPESVRWLSQRGRYEEAEEIVRDIARVNKKPVPDDLAFLRELSEKAKELKVSENQYSYHDLCRTRKMGARTFVLLFGWFTNSIFSYGITTMYDTLQGTVYMNTVVNNSASMVFGWTAIYTAERFGRRKTYVAYMAIPVVSMIGVLIVGAVGVKSTLPDLVTVLALVGTGGITAAWNIATIYISEIFPTLTRNIGMGACSMAARIGGILAPQVAYLGEVTHWTVPYMFYGAFSVTTMILVRVILPETKGKPLPENMPPRKKKSKEVPMSPDSEFSASGILVEETSLKCKADIL